MTDRMTINTEIHIYQQNYEYKKKENASFQKINIHFIS